MTVTLQEITADNWYEATLLRLDPSQEEYVSSNLFSIAEAQFDPDATNLAIYAEDAEDDDTQTMVGFLMYTQDGDIRGNYWINRLMIDKNHQRKGYGTAAMQAIIQRIKTQHNGNDISLTYVPENEVAARLYANLGFEETGEIDEGEIVVRLKQS